MSTLRYILTATVLGLAYPLAAQQTCAARLGGSWFIDCKHLVSYQGRPVVTFDDWSAPLRTVNLDVYSTRHALDAQVKNGKLVMGDPKRFEIKASETEFSLVDKSTQRVICILKQVPSTTKVAPCQVNVWLDLYMPGAGYFHCDPETSNEPMMQYMQDAVFKGNLSAISLQ